MIKLNIGPNEMSYNVLIEGYCSSGKTRREFELFDCMLQRGLKPHNYTYRFGMGSSKKGE
jgi:pentatricopeptide repeat protein